MKTKLNYMPDAAQLWRELDRSSAPTEADIDAEVLRTLSFGKVTFEPCDAPAEAGDRVTIKTSSVLKKYDREKTVLVVGSGLYDRVIEGMLIGMRAGESAEANIKGEQVRFSVTLVERRAYPELTDALVREQNIDGVETLPQYREYVTAKLRREYAEELTDRLLEQLDESAKTGEPDAQDVRMVIDREFEPLRARFLTGGMDLDTLSGEEWRKNFYNPELKAYYDQIYPDVAMLFDTTDKASFYANRAEHARDTIRCCLILREVLGERGEEYDPTLSLDAEKKLRAELTERIYAEIYGKG